MEREHLDGKKTMSQQESIEQSSLDLGRLKGPCEKYGFLGLLTSAPGAPEAPGEVPQGHAWAFRGSPVLSQEVPGTYHKPKQET